jgi:hypothetical protein
MVGYEHGSGALDSREDGGISLPVDWLSYSQGVDRGLLGS